jgi:hypothetical protein
MAFPAAMFLSTGAASAANNITITPWTFVGGVGDCGSNTTAGNASAVHSFWDYNTGNPAPSLFLQKNTLTSDCSAAGASFNNVNGITLTELNFQYENSNGGHCGAGAPRYNVVTTDNVTHFFGCADGTTSATNDPNWTEVTWDLNNPAQSFPPITTGEVVQSIDLVFDEGTDQGSGFVNLDNFSINGQTIGTASTPTNKNQCKNGGFVNFTDETGQTFKNQGQCIAFVNGNRNFFRINNHNNITATNSNSQTATTGNAKVKGNTTGGSASSGNASNGNSNSNTVNVSNNPSF